MGCEGSKERPDGGTRPQYSQQRAQYPVHQAPPPHYNQQQHPAYQHAPHAQPDPMYASQRDLNRTKADTLLDAQRHANIEQLMEVYPKLDREVIRGVVQETNGDQEKYHVTLAELSGNDMTAERRQHAFRWTVGQAVEANFQGQWHPATIQSIEPSGDYNVQWTEDGSHTLVTPNQIRATSIAGLYQ